jgi:hypothetical protein
MAELTPQRSALRSVASSASTGMPSRQSRGGPRLCVAEQLDDDARVNAVQAQPRSSEG